MIEPKFKIGDKVKTNRDVGDIPGDTRGVIVTISDDSESIGVDFKKVFDDYTHNLHNEIKTNTGYYINEKDLSLIKEKDNIFTPGMNLNKYVKQLIKNSSDSNRKKWLKTFDRCILPKEVKELIEESLIVVLRSEMFEKWGLNAQFEKGLTNSILLYGAAGTGKTMICESIAAVLDKNLLKLDTATLQSNIPGEMERQIKENFKKALDRDAVILIDECDSLLYNRDNVGAIMSSEINCLLTEIERFPGVVLFTTNRLHKLDDALQRRIIAKIELPKPTEKARREIWKSLIPKKLPLSDDFNINKLASFDLSGGEIKNAIILGSRRAISKNDNVVKMEYFLYAIDNIITNKNKFSESKNAYEVLQ